MAFSGTTTFEKTFSIDEVITEAFERLGFFDYSGNDLRTARRSLNIMFQEWANRGLHYWELGNLEIDLVEGQAEYKFFRNSADGTSATSIPNGVYGIDDVLEAAYRTNRATTSQSDSSLSKIDRSTYQSLANKLTKAQPTQYYVQRFIDNTTISFYPTPDTTAAANHISIYFLLRRSSIPRPGERAATGVGDGCDRLITKSGRNSEF